MKTARVIVSVLVVVAAIGSVYAVTRFGVAPDPVIAQPGTTPPRPPGAAVEVTYIANEGVLLAAGDTRVLIDGLHRQYRPAYPFLPEPYREQIETAQAPFDGIDLILVSHMHLDHFHAESVVRHLLANTTAALVSSEQVAGELRAHPDYSSVSARVRGIELPLRQKMAVRAGGVDVELLGIGHGSGRHATIQNLGHIVTLAGRKLLHIGDATTEDPGIFDALDLDRAGIDVAFLPVWFLTSDEGAAIVRQHIKPKHIVAVHMPAGESGRAAAQVRERFPDAVPFVALLEKKYY
jgi:L-ascorbate metabolism protein UlaG (beta-lactamase superfamily)